MALFRKTHKWNGWHGTLDDLVRAAQLGAEEVATWPAMEKDDDDEDRNKLVVRVGVKVGELWAESESLETVSTLSNSDREGVERINIIISRPRSWRDESRVDINVSNESPALRIEVHGEDRTRVEGLTRRLLDHLEEGGRRPRRYVRMVVWVLISLPFLFGFLGWPLARWLGFASQNGKWESAEIYMPVALFGVSALAVAALWYLTPDLQLLASDADKTRFRRFRGAVWFVVMSVIASIIAAVVISLSSSD